MQNIANIRAGYIPALSGISRWYFTTALLFFISFAASAQIQPTINSKLIGRVTDATTNEPLPGAVVRIEGTTHAVSTDLDGKLVL